MKTVTTFRYLELADPEVLHQETLKSISELKFLRYELNFLRDLISKNSVELMFGTSISESEFLTKKLSKHTIKLNSLITVFEKHNTHLKNFIEENKRPEKLKEYQDKHKKLIQAESEFPIKFKKTKKKVFQLLSALIKKGKQKKLMPSSLGPIGNSYQEKV